LVVSCDLQPDFNRSSVNQEEREKMAIKHSRQGIALGAVAALGVTMLGASPAFATGDADLIDLHIKAPWNGVTNALLDDGIGLYLDWDGDFDTEKLDTLHWRVISAVDQDGEDVEYDLGANYAGWDSYEDEVEYTWDEDEDLVGGDYNFWAPWYVVGTDSTYRYTTLEDANEDDVLERSGYVGPVSQDATDVTWQFNNNTMSGYDVEESYSPWMYLYTYEDYGDSDRTWTFRVQAWVDANLNGNVDSNEYRSAVTTVNIYNQEYLKGTVSAKTVPGWYDAEPDITATFPVKLNDYDWAEDDYVTYETLAEEYYYFRVKALDVDSNEEGDWDWIDLDYTVAYDDTGWDVDENGNVSYNSADTYSITNESKRNQVWLWQEDQAEDSTPYFNRSSNIATFGYGISSKIAKVNNTSAKMYAYNVLNAGVVEFFHNGKRVARFDITDATDPRALAGSDGPYVVRTVNFVRGKNTLELKLNGVSVKKHTYTLRAGMV